MAIKLEGGGGKAGPTKNNFFAASLRQPKKLNAVPRVRKYVSKRRKKNKEKLNHKKTIISLTSFVHPPDGRVPVEGAFHGVVGLGRQNKIDTECLSDCVADKSSFIV